ncbi:TraH family protein [Rhizobium sp.]|jgi:hypothetical protein|uniref:TraH family protein n=1 Tax=Rhizobium sp. TaxID=391 RepID=UPI000E9DA7E0|nr:conjugal transfer protein TraH [Rhizobium sp.]
MFDAALIHQCADPSLKIEIVQEFIREVGSTDPLTVTVKSNSKTFLLPKPKTKDEALELARNYLGTAVVRVGVTQYPAGLGLTDPSELSADLFDACKNISMGTKLFAKVYRITTAWYKAPAKEAFDDAIYAWGTGYFDGKNVFTAPEPDPGRSVKLAVPSQSETPEDGSPSEEPQPQSTADQPKAQGFADADPNKAGIAIDLSGIKDHNKE